MLNRDFVTANKGRLKNKGEARLRERGLKLRTCDAGYKKISFFRTVVSNRPFDLTFNAIGKDQTYDSIDGFEMCDADPSLVNEVRSEGKINLRAQQFVSMFYSLKSCIF